MESTDPAPTDPTAPMELESSTRRRRLLGLVLIALVIGFVAVTVLQYNKAFTPTSTIYLVTDSAGNALPDRADVKARGILMGTVGAREARDGKVVLRLDLTPELAKQVPPGTTARLLPKTLFGQWYAWIFHQDSRTESVEMTKSALAQG